MLVTVEDTVDVYRYTIHNHIETFNSFRQSASNLLAYVKYLEPNPKYEARSKALATYQLYIVKLVSNILAENNHPHKTSTILHMNTDQYLVISYNKLMDFLNLPKYTLTSSIDFYKDVWGPKYWDFLHLTSILLQSSIYVYDFSCILLNFDLVLSCSQCAFNFKRKDILKELTIKIKQTKDTIRALFDFHNIVNIALHKNYFPIDKFLDLYKLDQKYLETKEYKEVIQYE